MNRLLVVGAGDFGREVLCWVESAEGTQSDWRVGGFLDDDLGALGDRRYEHRIIESISRYQPSSTDRLVMGIADPTTKLQIAESLEARGASFATFIHPSALISRNVSIDRGTVVCPRAIVSCDTWLGAFVSVNVCATIGHDVKIAEGCTISSHADLMGFVELGRGVFVGSHAAVLPRTRVGAGAKLGAGSLVIRKVEAGLTVLGVPAKVV